MNNFNIDENMINKLQNMLNKGELNDVVSQISPEMLQNFSSMMNGANSNNNSQRDAQNSQNIQNSQIFKNSGSSQGFQNNSNSQGSQNFQNNSNSQAGQGKQNSQGFDFSNIDMNTILKMKSVMDKLNTSNDPRSNLLYSLKPYLRDSKKEKLDQYANLLNVARIAELLKNNNKENDGNG